MLYVQVLAGVTGVHTDNTCLYIQVLPDLTELRWSYNGTATMHEQEANTWVMYSKEEMGYGEIISTYTMYVAKVCLIILRLLIL